MIDAGAFAIAADHPALPGHFPNDPVVPGVMLLDEVACLILDALPGRRLAGMPQTKFLHPVRPDETVRVTYAPGADRIAFACHVGAVEAVRGTLLLAPA